MFRRGFLKQSLFFGSSFLLPSFVISSEKKIYSQIEDGFVYYGIGIDVFRFDTISRRIEMIECGIRAHSFLQLPGFHRILAIEKWRKRAVVVDFSRKKIEKTLVAKENRHFYGHACLSLDKTTIYTIQVDHKTGISFLVRLDSQSLEIEQEYPLILGGAHELAFLPDGKTLAIAATGWRPIYESVPLDFSRVDFSRVLFFDIEKNRIIQEKILKDSFLSFAHLKVTASGRVILISDIMHSFWSRKLHGRIYDTSLNDEIFTWPIDDKLALRGELLSLEINERSGLVAVTNPIGSKTIIFSLDKKQVIDHFQTDSRSVCISSNGKSIFSMLPVDGLHSVDHHGPAPIVPIPHAGKAASSHSLFVRK